MRLKISSHVSIPLTEIQFQAIRAQGAGGQNVNKVSSAVHLRFDIEASSLPDSYKAGRMENLQVRVALARLRELVMIAGTPRKRRKPTKPTRGSQKRRVDSKTKRGQLKSQRGKVPL